MNKHNLLKPVGAWETRRSINLPTLTWDVDSQTIETALRALPGVRHLTIERDRQRIEIRYDARLTDFRSITQVLSDFGFSPPDNWWNRTRASWYQFTDTNARDNANAPAPACCNKPPR